MKEFKKSQKSILVIFIVILLGVIYYEVNTNKYIDSIEMESPDGNIIVNLSNKDSLSYSLSLNDDQFISDSNLGISIDGNNIFDNAKIVSIEEKYNDSTYASMENSNIANDLNNEYIINFENEDSSKYSIVWKIFNNGAAFQYVFKDDSLKRIDNETSEFTIDQNSSVFYNTELLDMQEVYKKSHISDLKENTIMAALPTFKLPYNKGYISVSEANLKDYSGMALKYMGASKFSAHYWNTINGFDTTAQSSPWRIIFVADNLNNLVNNTIAQNLNDVPAGDFDWVKTGKATWFKGYDKEGNIIEEEAVKNLQAAQKLNIEYMVIGNNWRSWSDNEDKAFEKVAKISDLCKEYGVGLFIGNDVPDIDQSGDNMYDDYTREEFLEKAKAAGVAGIKFGHIQMETPQAVNIYRQIMQEALEKELLIIFHNSNKPTGLNRTYPNLLTQEGVKGMQYNLNTTNANVIPYTRLLTGGADFTPLSLSNTTRMGDGTLTHMLANTVIIRSNLLTFMESPYNIENSDVSEFISKVHSSWDETIVLDQSEIGELSAFVRRKDNEYFLAIQNSNSENKKLQIKLNFLEEGKKYKSLEYRDDIDDRSQSIRYSKEYQKDDILEINLLEGGGFVSIFEEAE
ncbi:glycoside hydrolase family 97 N-terminal domain-containing protein [Anaerococcus cruorum]|uniref:Glycoside hydrolase family 97 N-terminal domain-containing protein n=1 Tax=Anaerococcus cruorum TaxID=3115617 RepID=A0ABW9MV07_9FIRM